MNWDQIEDSWAAMTRRVRPDLPGFVASAGRGPASPQGSDDVQPRAIEAQDATKAQTLAPVPIQIA